MSTDVRGGGDCIHHAWIDPGVCAICHERQRIDLDVSPTRALLAAIPEDDRCAPGCPGWGVFHSDSRGWEIEVCDQCFSGRDRIADDAVAEFPEAQAALTRESGSALRCRYIHDTHDPWDVTSPESPIPGDQHPLAQGDVRVTCPACRAQLELAPMQEDV